MYSFIIAFHFTECIGQVVVVVSIEGVTINGILIVFNGFIVAMKGIIGGSKLVIPLRVILELFQQCFRCRDSVIITSEGIVGVGKASIGGSKIITLQFLALLNQGLIS